MGIHVRKYGKGGGGEGRDHSSWLPTTGSYTQIRNIHELHGTLAAGCFQSLMLTLPIHHPPPSVKHTSKQI